LGGLSVFAYADFFSTECAMVPRNVKCRSGPDFAPSFRDRQESGLPRFGDAGGFDPEEWGKFTTCPAGRNAAPRIGAGTAPLQNW
jgi:hypothetical protein